MSYRPALINVALLDEHAVVLAGLQQLLVEEEDFRVVLACRSLQDLRAQLPLLSRPPDIVVVDPLSRSPLGLLQIEEIRPLLPSTVLVVFCARPRWTQTLACPNVSLRQISLASFADCFTSGHAGMRPVAL